MIRTSLLEQSRNSFQKSIEIDATNYEPFGFLGRDETLAARWWFNRENLRVLRFNRPKRFAKAIELNKEETNCLSLYADLLRRRSWMASITEAICERTDFHGMQIVKKNLELDSTSAETYALEGTFIFWRQRAKDKDTRSNLISKSKASLEYALKLNRWLKKGISTRCWNKEQTLYDLGHHLIFTFPNPVKMI